MKRLKRIFLARAAMTLALAVTTSLGVRAQEAVTISSPDDWDAFATEVNNGTNDYNGKTVTLETDITVSTMVGTSENKFCGTFNGGGHTLSLSYETAEAYCAPFRYVDGATITGLIVDGTITTTSDHAAGFIGCSYGETTIENSRSSVTINSSVEGDGIHAGFIAETSLGSTTAITGCVFDGSLLGESTDHCGGFVGLENGTVSITNCLFAPTACTFGSTDSYTFVRQGTDATVTNSYYTETLGTAQGKKSLSITSGDEYLTISVIPMGTNNISYSVSGISVFSDYDYSSSTYIPHSFTYNGTYYFGSGNMVRLSFTDSREGYTYEGYEASAGEPNYNYLTMSDEDVTITGLWSKNVIIAYTESGVGGGKAYVYSSKRNAENNYYLSFNEGEVEVRQKDLDEDRYIYVSAMPDGIHSLNGIKASDFVVTAGENESIEVVAATDGEGLPIPGRFKFLLPADENAVVSISFTGTFSNKPMTRTTYIDAAGESKTYDVYVLDGTETSLGQSGYDIPLTYLANSDLTYSHNLQLESDVNIILGDDKTVIFGSSANRISPPVILGVDYNLGIYSQSRSENMGKMNLYGYNLGMQVKTLTIGGGDYVVNTYSPCFSVSGDVLITGIGLMEFESYNPAIISTQGNVTVRGGSIDAKMSSTPCISATYGNVSITEISSLKLESSGNGAISCGGNLIISGTDDSVLKLNDEVTSYSNPAISAGGNISISAHDVYVGNTNPIALNCKGTSGTVSISADNINLKSNNNAIDAKGDINIADFSTLSVETINGCGLTTTGSITLNGKLVKVNDETTSSAPAITCSGSIIINADELYAGNRSSYTAANGKSVTITAGKIVAKGQSSAIRANDGDITIPGGQLTVATQYTSSIYAKNNINLGWTNTSDFILIGSENYQTYSYSGTVIIAEGQSFMDEDGTIYSGTLTDEEKAAIGGKKLKPYNPVTLTLAEGQTWMTYYQNDDLAYSLGEGAQAYYVSAVGSDVVTLKPIDNVPSGLPVLINCSGEVTLTPIVGGSAAPADADAQFQGTAKALEAIPDYDAGRTYVLYHGQFLIADTNSGIAANKCWLTLEVPEVSIDARLSLVINDDATSITSIPTTEGDGNWYDLQGRRLANEPTQHGLYIYKGKKVRK